MGQEHQVLDYRLKEELALAGERRQIAQRHMIDRMELTEQAVYILNAVKLLPHYSLPCFVAPGFSKDTPTKLWSEQELRDAGAVESSALLWPRHTLAMETYHG